MGHRDSDPLGKLVGEMDPSVWGPDSYLHLCGGAQDEDCRIERQQQGQAQRVDLSYLNITQDALSTQSFIFMI